MSREFVDTWRQALKECDAKLQRYSFVYGSRGRRASPVSPVGKCWLWGFLGLPNPFSELFLCGFGVFLGSQPLLELGSRVLRVPGVPLSPPWCLARVAPVAHVIFFGSQVVPGEGCSSGAFCVFCRFFF